MNVKLFFAIEVLLKLSFSLQPIQKFLQFSCPKHQFDTLGNYWPIHCQNGTPLLFKRIYSSKGWTYQTHQVLGNPNFQNRIQYQISRCLTGDTQKDQLQKTWKLWCYSNGRKVAFEREGRTYLQDYQGGFPQFDYRRIIDPNSLLIELPYACTNMQGDTSGRYFLSQYLNSGKRVSYQRDTNGNFVWNPKNQQRILPGMQNQQKSVCGEMMELQKDLFQNFFWVIERQDQDVLDFIRSETLEEVSQGMYKIDPLTGKRLKKP